MAILSTSLKTLDIIKISYVFVLKRDICRLDLKWILGKTSQENSSQNHSLLIKCYITRSNDLSFPFKFSRNEVFLCTADVVAADDKL